MSARAEGITDHGKRTYVFPQNVFRPKDFAEVLTVSGLCTSSRYKTALRGNGCSSNELTLSEEAIIDCRSISYISLDRRTGCIVVGGGTSIGEISSWLEKNNRFLPVLPSNPSATIGGVLSAGGIGQTSIRSGPLAEYISEVTLVTPDKGLMQINFENEPRWRVLFGCFGSLGLILEVKIKTEVGLREFAISSSLIEERDIDSVINLLREGEPNFLVALYDFRKNRFKVEKGYLLKKDCENSPRNCSVVTNIHAHVHMKETTHLARQAALFSTLGNIGRLCNIWADFFIPAKHAKEFDIVLSALDHKGIIMPMINFGVYESYSASKFLKYPLLPISSDELYVSFGIYATVMKESLEDVDGIFSSLRKTCLQLQGRQYLHGAFPRTRSYLEEQFGAGIMSQIEKLKDECDYSRVLNGLPI